AGGGDPRPGRVAPVFRGVRGGDRIETFDEGAEALETAHRGSRHDRAQGAAQGAGGAIRDGRGICTGHRALPPRPARDGAARQRLEQTRADPEMQLDLLQWLARLNSELDLLEPASALSERSIALARELHGEDSLPVAEALMQKAENLFRAASYVEAASVAREV